jgi:hypothetical protein
VAERARRIGSRLGHAAVGLAAAVQLILGFDSARGWIESEPPAWLHAAETPLEPLACSVRVLPELAAGLPRGARLLLLAQALPRLQLEFYFLPRPCRLLVDLPLEHVALFEQHHPKLGWYGVWRRAQLVARGQLFSEEAFSAALAHADFVVAHAFSRDLSREARLAHLSTQGCTVLYAVRR